MRIRYFGFLANRNKREALDKCRNLLEADEPITFENRTVREIMPDITGRDIEKCPFCRTGNMKPSKNVALRTGTNPYDIVHRTGEIDRIQRE